MLKKTIHVSLPKMMDRLIQKSVTLSLNVEYLPERFLDYKFFNSTTIDKLFIIGCVNLESPVRTESRKHRKHRKNLAH